MYHDFVYVVDDAVGAVEKYSFVCLSCLQLGRYFGRWADVKISLIAIVRAAV